MLSGTRRVCSGCLGRSLRTAARLQIQLRFQSTIPPSSDSSISPLLINRARSVAAQYADISSRIADSYDVDAAKKLGELSTVTQALKDWEEARNSLNELQALLNDASTDKELRSLAESDIASTSKSLQVSADALKQSLIPTHPFAHLPCLIEIHPGAGGSEASLFAHSLLNMFTSLCDRLGYSNQLASYSADDAVSSTTPGLTSAILEVTKPGSYDLFRTEAGVHRVQRVPTTEKKGRTHTSAVSVLVLPSFPTTTTASESSDFNNPQSDLYIDPSTVRSETMRAKGAGGQHVNKTDSAIRLTHIPTGTVVAMQDSRSQHSNREKAWNLLRSKIAQMRREEREAELIRLRRETMGLSGVDKGTRMGREDKIRTYNFSQSRVTDHRCGVETGGLEDVLNGGVELERLMEGVRGWMAEGDIRGVIAEEEEQARRGKGEAVDGGHVKAATGVS